jgi:hypothetical protein
MQTAKISHRTDGCTGRRLTGMGFRPDIPCLPCLPASGHYEKLNWRMVSKPGGATVKPDDFYRLYGLHMQVTAPARACAHLRAPGGCPGCTPGNMHSRTYALGERRARKTLRGAGGFLRAV